MEKRGVGVIGEREKERGKGKKRKGGRAIKYF